MQFEDSREFAGRLDDGDALARFRERFAFPGERDGLPAVYFCGHSLGLQPDLAASYVSEELDEWAHRGVDGHFDARRPWVRYHRYARDALAELTGAQPSEVVAMNTLTVNLHLLMASFYRPDAGRYRIVIEAPAFPSDRYAAASQLRLHGREPEEDLLGWHPRDDGALHVDDLAALLDREGDRVALLLLPGVQYFSGQVLDMAAICALGREHGCAVGLDLAHAIGNVELRLHEWAPDFAAWCGYKYLNAGPGAIGGAFVHERHFNDGDLDQLHGWWGNAVATRFEMRPQIDPADGAERWQLSCPPVLSFAPVLASLELFREAGMANLIGKSEMLTGYLAWLIEKRFEGRLRCITPGGRRGCQLSLTVADAGIDAGRLFARLQALNVVGDWREPGIIRLAPVPMYNSFTDVFVCAERLERALGEAQA